MKKASKLFFSVLAMFCIMTSCEKEGVYNPKEKISRIYYSEKSVSQTDYEGTGVWETETKTTEKTLKEIWNWDGKTLTSIDYYDSYGDFDYSETFLYDGKRLSSIETQYSKFTMTYDGKYISRIECYTKDSKKWGQYDFVHDGKKITKISYSAWELLDNKSIATLSNALRFFIPNMDNQIARKMFSKNNGQKDGMTTSFELTWDGDNITKITTKEYSQEFSYDNKLNPYKGLFNLDEMGGISEVSVCSKNNVTKCVSNYDFEKRTTEYTYTYNGKFPETKSYTDGFTSDHVKYRITTTTYYEYK